MMRTLALTLSTRFDHEEQDFINHSYANYFAGLGWDPILVSNALESPRDFVERRGITALVITGGNDITSEVDGVVSDHASSRDRTERDLLDWAISTGTPVLGICRGLHMINAFMGGRVSFNVHEGGLVPRSHVKTFHEVLIQHAFIREVVGRDGFFVNSFHRNGLFRDGLGRCLRVGALSACDELVEAVIHQSLPVFGIQWHPEREDPSKAENKRLICAALSGGLWEGGRNEGDHPSRG